MKTLCKYFTQNQQRLLTDLIDEIRQDGLGYGRIVLVYDHGELKFVESQRSLKAMSEYLEKAPVALENGRCSSG